MTNLAHAAGWYPDPENPAQQRWWDGAAWTSNVQPAPSPGQAPGLTAVPAIAPRTSGLAIASFVTSLIGLGLVPVVLGICGLVSISRARRTAAPRTGGWMAWVGIVFGGLQLLLVPLLIAAAIPTFLGQKAAAEGTKAKANLQLIANDVEACAASSSDGSYSECDTAEALGGASAQLLERGCDAPGGACLEVVDGGDAYEVTTRVEAGSTDVKYTARHESNGDVERSCAPNADRICESGTF